MPLLAGVAVLRMVTLHRTVTDSEGNEVEASATLRVVGESGDTLSN